MKHFFIALGAALMLASPALAQNYYPNTYPLTRQSYGLNERLDRIQDQYEQQRQAERDRILWQDYQQRQRRQDLSTYGGQPLGNSGLGYTGLRPGAGEALR